MKLLLAGATGLVGSHVLRLALEDAAVERVVAPTRRPLPAHPKLDAPLIDWDALPADAAWWRVDAVVCALGTTMRTAGSREAFRQVDFDYPLAVARLARDAGARAYALNSALGADTGSRIFYNRVKGELELALADVGFESLTYVRPGLIEGERQESRPSEAAATVLLRAVGPLLPKRWRLNPAPRIARALLEAALLASPGVHAVGSERLV
ncbi:NAD-dependent epimerase/dehydratase family protein [Lysobacter sp. K5869]|uniref:NAD-dependent epimerase/dehydratase family protein n=1 Tax=Lysobacter sp. K5869 TaxID=2820808 RepID=UPI001C05F476|nr:NAD-dependent epimerase/dehydratase family protein [Lysobacter sp. K5869]QWP79446.1 NAD-dependent epimerase/dehydratase family protein [Lysobacter sp. K5869]